MEQKLELDINDFLKNLINSVYPPILRPFSKNITGKVLCPVICFIVLISKKPN